MQFEPTFEYTDALAPFDGPTVAGVDPRQDISVTSPFLRAKDARTAARRKERAADVDADAPSADADWQEVVDTALTILTDVGKDLEVAAWLIEGLVRIDGYAGLYTGTKLAEGLIRTFWDGAYPRPDEDGDDGRIAAFIALNGVSDDGTLIQPLRKVPITGGDDPLSFWQYHQAQELSQIADQGRIEARRSPGFVSLQTFSQAVLQTPASFYASLMEQIGASLEAMDALSEAFGERVGVEAPPAGSIRDVLASVRDAVRSFAADKLAQAETAAAGALIDAEAAAAADDGTAGGAAVATGAVGGGGGGAPFDREKALRQLIDLAAVFRKYEPHSPVSYALEEIVRRARLPLDALLDELIVDPEARKYFFIASGVRPPEG